MKLILRYTKNIPPSYAWIASVCTLELESSKFSKDLPFLLRTLPASFSNSANLFFSSVTSGFAVPSFSSLISTTNSNMSMASSNLFCT